MICTKIYKIRMNVEMCEMCRPDNHALYIKDWENKPATDLLRKMF